MTDDPRIAIVTRWFNIDEWSCKRLLCELDAATPRPAADDARATPPGEALVPWQPPPDRPEPNTTAGLYLMRSHVDWLLRKCGFAEDAR